MSGAPACRPSHVKFPHPVLHTRDENQASLAAARPGGCALGVQASGCAKALQMPGAQTAAWRTRCFTPESEATQRLTSSRRRARSTALRPAGSKR